ncbi:hypothetical protein BGX34_011575, partial [Mortierella sp. NVP85]
MYLNNAYDECDPNIALVLCHEIEASLVQAKKAAKQDNHVSKGEIGTAFISLGRLLEDLNHPEADTIRKKGEKLGRKSSHIIVTVPSHIFAENVRPLTIKFKLPEPDERLDDMIQLTGCLGLMKTTLSPGEKLETAAEEWLQAIKKDTVERKRLETMAIEVVRAFKRDELKDAKAIAEVVHIAPVLSKDAFQGLLREFISGFNQSVLLDVHQLNGIVELVQSAPEFLDADDLVKILGLFSNRLRDTHQQSSHHMYLLTLAVSHVLDAMADNEVNDVDREKIHTPLSLYLAELKQNDDSYLIYQAAYAYQALLCVPDNETKWKAAMRRTLKVTQGVSGLVSAVYTMDLNKLLEGLGDIQDGLAEASRIVEVTIAAYDRVSTLVESGQDFMESLKEGLSFDRKRDWYSALRAADALIRNGELATFKEMVCNAPCRLDPAFQWGVCQRLGEIAANPLWDTDVRRSAIAFLGVIYREDILWGQKATIKQWILSILMQLASSSGDSLQLHNTLAEAQLQELEANGDEKKRALYKACRKNGPVVYPLKIVQPEVGSFLLDRVQNRPDVDGNIRLLKRQRTKGRTNSVYIPPQAKSSLQVADDTKLPLMEKVQEFLKSEKKVFLLHGDSGSGKSTFNHVLEYDLWRLYRNGNDSIPLYISLPAIDKPEHDLIAKQLRKVEFTESQIREMKNRKFILICDGYDESQQTHNLYTSNQLNQEGGWNAQMVISCRTEYLGTDYRDRFQPVNRNRESDSALYQEAVITPFSPDQVDAYIHQYVSIHQPLWQEEDYKQALKHIPSLKDLVRNPFLMALSLEVLPRMVDPGRHLSTARVTRVGLYDHFIEQWIERGKKRLGEKDMAPQARAAFERLSDEGFTLNGIEYLKALAVAIYKEQGGQSIVEYSTLIDKKSWKAEFFSHEDNQLLREACPLTRNGNQHRFIHRSLLEYGLARAIFDPQDKSKKSTFDSVLGRRASVSSTLSFEIEDDSAQIAITEEEPNHDSPLVWKSFVNDHSLLQFLEERVQQEAAFKELLFKYIKYSKKDKKWRKAAANAITILVRAGIHFIGIDLQGIQIPGADLSYGVFDSAQLQEADLRKVNLRGAWLRETDLSRARMTGVQFGELPFLSQEFGVYSCAYSPDGKSFVLGLGGGHFGLYDTSIWEGTQIWSGNSHKVRCIAYSPNGDWIVYCGQDNNVRLWKAGKECLPRNLIGHTGPVNCIAYSPRGDYVASGSEDTTLRLWDVAGGYCLRTFSGQASVACVAYSPNGRQIASGGADHNVRLWNVETGDFARVPPGHRGRVLNVKYSPQGDLIASTSEDATVMIWDVTTRTCRHTLSGHIGSVYVVAFSPKGDQVASGGADRTVRLWDIETGRRRQTLTGHTLDVTSVVYSPKGDHVASGSRDKTVRLWDASSGAARIVSSGHSADVKGVKCSLSGNLIASCSKDRTIRLWDVDTGACRHILRGHKSSVDSIALSPKGDRIISVGADRKVRLWNAGSGSCLKELQGHSDIVYGIAYSPCGGMFVSANNEKTVRVWSTVTGVCCRRLEGNSDGFVSVVYSPSGSQIASGAINGTVHIWDAVTVKSCRILHGHTNWVVDVVYSPQGSQLASASHDHTVRLWDVGTGTCYFTLTGHSHRVDCIAYSQRGDLLASGSWDKTVRLWNTASGQCRAEIRNFQGNVYGVAWGATSAGDYLVTGSEDGSVLKWDVKEEGEQHRVHLLWTTNARLTVNGTCTNGVRGLSQINRKLLKQRGAVGEPEHLFREVSKNVTTMTS